MKSLSRYCPSPQFCSSDMESQRPLTTVSASGLAAIGKARMLDSFSVTSPGTRCCGTGPKGSWKTSLTKRSLSTWWSSQCELLFPLGQLSPTVRPLLSVASQEAAEPSWGKLCVNQKNLKETSRNWEVQRELWKALGNSSDSKRSCRV